MRSSQHTRSTERLLEWHCLLATLIRIRSGNPLDLIEMPVGVNGYLQA
jgi:hypothetical protein